MSSPAWFILILLDFNIIYAFAHGEPLKVAAPGVGMLLLLGFAVGLYEVIVPASGSAFGIPSGFHFLPLYVSFFCGGIMAARNKWLETFVNFPAAINNVLRGITLTILLAMLALAFDLFYYADASAKAQADGIMNLLSGIYAVTITLVELQLFYRYCNLGGRFSKALAEAAYGAYLLHPIFLIFATWSYAQIIKAAGMTVVNIPSEAVPVQVYEYAILDGTQGTLWLALGYVSIVTNFVWPCAYLLKKLPGFRLVL